MCMKEYNYCWIIKGGNPTIFLSPFEVTCLLVGLLTVFLAYFSFKQKIQMRWEKFQFCFHWSSRIVEADDNIQ